MKLKLSWLSLILGVGLILRLIFIFTFEPNPVRYDAEIYDKLGWNLAQGKGYTLVSEGTPTTCREPGYPYFLALIYFIFGHSYLAVRLIQTILSTLICWIIYLIGQEVVDKKVGLIAACLLALYPPWIAYASEILQETSFSFLLAITLLFLTKAIKSGSLKMYLLSGLFLGLSTVTRGTTLLYPFFLFIGLLIVRTKIKQAFLNTLIVFLGMLIFLGPWIVRNYLLFGAFIPVRAENIGELLWVGSYVPWDGDWKGYQEPLTSLKRGLDPVLV